jgi:putative transposase
VRDLAILFLHLLGTRLAGPGGARSVAAESVLVKQQLLILNRSRKRSPNLRLSDRLVAGLCALLMRPGRRIRSAIVLKPSTLLSLHRALGLKFLDWPALLQRSSRACRPKRAHTGTEPRLVPRTRM